MNVVSQVSFQGPQWDSIQESNERIQLKIYPEPCAPEVLVNRLASIEGPIELYSWYEGNQNLPKSGADFMKQFIFEPLYKVKQDAKLYLYSLRAWEFKKNVSRMASSTPIGEAINRINTTAIECIYSSSFFQFCTLAKKEGGLYGFLNEELPKKKWLYDLSESKKNKGMTVAQLFNEQISLFDCIKALDVSAAYSPMQYVEGYYLIQESVKRALVKGQNKVQIAFILPNDENKYYLDYPNDIEKMLQLDFGKELSKIDVNISFQFFEYGGSLNSRPYIDRTPKAPKVGVKDIGSYFDYLSSQQKLQNISGEKS